MRRSAVLSLTALTLGGLAFGVVPTTPVGELIATPVACEEGDVTPDGRVFPEPMASATFLSFAEFECGMERLVAEHPDRLRMDVLVEEGAGVSGALYDVVMTDMSVPATEKERLLVMSSIHGNEVGAREGAARQIEDMLAVDAVTDIDDEELQEVVVANAISAVPTYTFVKGDEIVADAIKGANMPAIEEVLDDLA